MQGESNSVGSSRRTRPAAPGAARQKIACRSSTRRLPCSLAPDRPTGADQRITTQMTMTRGNTTVQQARTTVGALATTALLGALVAPAAVLVDSTPATAAPNPA